jgi:hypothetical protein
MRFSAFFEGSRGEVSMTSLGINHLSVNAVAMELTSLSWFIGGENTAVLQLDAVPFYG